MAIDESTIADHIADYIDENEVEDATSISEIEGKINKIEQLRTSYRKKHKELKLMLGSKYGEVYEKDHDKKLSSVKEYIKKANHFKKEMVEHKSKANIQLEASKIRSKVFLFEEVEATIKSLYGKFSVNITDMNGGEISDRKNELPKQVQKLENLSKMVHDILECSESAMENRINDIMDMHRKINKLNKNPKDKADVIESEVRLQSLGYVEYVKNLSTKQQEMLRTNKIQNYIPWRAVWNGNSVSTPCRVVYDASQPTPSGISLNDILAKGKNNMNKLVEIVIR